MTRQRLFFWGMVLFLLGLLTGLIGPAFKNPRMGLSAHLEGLMNGIFLVLAGLIWERLNLSPKKQALTFGLLVWGGYANWLACLLAAVTGASRMTPIAGSGFSAGPSAETLVSVLFISVGLTMTAAVGLMVWGLGRKRIDKV